MDPISSVNAADLTRQMVGSVTDQQSAVAKKVVAAGAAQQMQAAKVDGIGVVLDAVA